MLPDRVINKVSQKDILPRMSKMVHLHVQRDDGHIYS